MPRKRESGPSRDYTRGEANALSSELSRALNRRGTGQGIRVKAQIEWGGVIDRKNNGIRETLLDRLSPSEMRRLEDSHRYRSYGDIGWHAQLRRLTETQRGREAAESAGLSPSRETFTRWLSEEQTPSRENMSRINRAYERTASGGQETPAEALTGIMANRGHDVRFRHISKMEFE